MEKHVVGLKLSEASITHHWLHHTVNTKTAARFPLLSGGVRLRKTRETGTQSKVHVGVN